VDDYTHLVSDGHLSIAKCARIVFPNITIGKCTHHRKVHSLLLRTAIALASTYVGDAFVLLREQMNASDHFAGVMEAATLGTLNEMYVRAVSVPSSEDFTALMSAINRLSAEYHDFIMVDPPSTWAASQFQRPCFAVVTSNNSGTARIEPLATVHIMCAVCVPRRGHRS
jgi:hypothetical protein